VAAKCCLDEHHQDQLLIYAALAGGRSELLVGEELSLHTHSLIYVLQKFIPGLEIAHEENVLIVNGIGFKRN
jgi:RNA 3'-terminal phosphate cyclase